MRKVILDLTTSLDGFIEGPDGEIDWIVDDDRTDFGDILNGILEGIDTIFYGRKSFELWGNYSPEGNISEKMNQAYRLLHSKKKVVFSRTMNTVPNVQIINNDLEKTLRTMLNEPGGNIWLYGGAELITTFVNLDLIDIYRISLQPVIIGAGKPLFQNINRKIKLNFRGVKSSASGVIALEYERIIK